jgi:hypothetical protein
MGCRPGYPFQVRAAGRRRTPGDRNGRPSFLRRRRRMLGCDVHLPADGSQYVLAAKTPNSWAGTTPTFPVAPGRRDQSPPDSPPYDRPDSRRLCPRARRDSDRGCQNATKSATCDPGGGRLAALKAEPLLSPARPALHVLRSSVHPASFDSIERHAGSDVIGVLVIDPVPDAITAPRALGHQLQTNGWVSVVIDPVGSISGHKQLLLCVTAVVDGHVISVEHIVRIGFTVPPAP